MTEAGISLQRALLYDDKEKTLRLSAQNRNLGAAQRVVSAAFGPDVLVIRQVQETAVPDTAVPDLETVCWQGITNLYDNPGIDRDIYLEFGLRDGNVRTLLILIHLPAQWQLSDKHDALLKSNGLSEIMLQEATLVVSYGLSAVSETRKMTVGAHNGDGSGDAITVDLSGYPLDNGWQLIVRGETAPSLLTRDHQPEIPAGPRLPADILLPPQDVPPTHILIRSMASAAWIDMERWWNGSPPDGEAARSEQDTVRRPGLATRYFHDQPDENYSYYLLEYGAESNPIVIEARLIANRIANGSDAYYPVRYSTRLAARTPLGEAEEALAALMGNHDGMFTGVELPKEIDLLGLTYAPKEWIQFSFAAGDYTDKDKHLIDIGLGPGDSQIQLREVDFNVLWALGGKTEAVSPLELDAYLTLFGEQFRVHVQPWRLIEGGLDDIDGVDLGQLIAKAMPTGMSLPFGLDSIRLSEAWISCYLTEERKPERVNMRLRLDGKVDLVPPAPGAVELDAVEVFFAHTFDDGGAGQFLSEVRLTAEFKLGPVEMIAQVSHDSTGWVVHGQVHAEADELSLRKLIDHLVHHFGATVPDEIPDVALESLSLEYATGPSSLTIQAITAWEFAADIPILGGNQSHDRVLLQLALTRDDQGGKNQTALTIDWTHEQEKGRLTANAFLSRDDQAFSIDFAVTDPQNPVTLTDLTDEIGLPDIPRPAAGVLDEIFQVSHLALDYDRASKLFSVAWARPLPDVGGQLVAEYDQQGGAAGQSRHVEVSWLALQPDETIGIDNLLQLMGAANILGSLKSWLPSVFSDVVDDVEAMLTFRRLGFDWHEAQENDTFTITALSNWPHHSVDNPRGAGEQSGGSKAFVTFSRGDREGLIAGISLLEEPLADQGGGETAPAREPIVPSFLPAGAKSFLELVADVLEDIELTHLLVSTVQSQNFRPPVHTDNASLPGHMRQPDTAVSFPFGSGPMPVAQGLSLGVRVRFGKDDLIRKIVDIDEIDGQIILGEEIALQISIPKRVSLGSGDNAMALTAPMIQIAEGEAGIRFMVMGSMKASLFGEHVDLSVWVTLSEEAINAHLQIRELTAINHEALIPMLPGVQIVVEEAHPLSFDLGVEFEPPGLDLGFQGSFAIYKDADNLVYGDIGIVLELVEAIPQPQYVNFDIDELSIPVLLEALTGIQYILHKVDELAKEVEDVAGDGEVGDTAGEVSGGVEAIESAIGHIEAIMNKVELKDVGLRWCDGVVDLPDGTIAMPGVSFHGDLSIFGWDAFALVEIAASPMPGFTGHFETEKLEIGSVLKIWGDGKGLRTPPRSGADVNKAQQQQAGDTPDNPDDGKWFLEPGGPILHISTRSSPFLHADLHAQLFGFMHTDIHADITDEGFDFDFKIDAGNAVTADLECHWWHDEGRLEAHGDLGVHLNGDIGPLFPGTPKIHLDTNLDAHAKLSVTNEEFKLTVNGDFEYKGATMQIPELVIDVHFSSLEALADAVWDHIVDEAKHIFAEILGPVVEVVKDAAKAVAHVAAKAAEEVADVAVAAADEAKKIVGNTVEVMDKVGEEAIGAAKKAASDMNKEADKAMTAALDEAAKITGPLLDEAQELKNRAVDFAKEAAAEVADAARKVAAVVSEAAQYVIDVAAKAAQWVGEKLDQARRWVSARLAEAKAIVKQLADEAAAAVRAIEDQIHAVEREIAHVLDSIEHAASGVWHAVTPW